MKFTMWTSIRIARKLFEFNFSIVILHSTDSALLIIFLPVTGNECRILMILRINLVNFPFRVNNAAGYMLVIAKYLSFVVEDSLYSSR